MNFRKGDVVTLKSGSASMTVEDVRSDGKIKVTWFKDGEVKSAFVENEAIEKVD